MHPRIVIKDKLIWCKSENDNFSVKSTYKVVRDINNIDGGTSTNIPLNIYNKIKNLNVPSDLTLFIWKMVKNLLSTVQNLIYHHMKIDD